MKVPLMSSGDGQVSRLVTANADDGYYASTTGTDFFDTAAVIVAGDSLTVDLGLWARFPTWPSLIGLTILDARLELTAGADSGSETTLTNIGAEDAAAPAAPTSAANARAKTLTTASVAWDNVPYPGSGQKYRSPNLKTIIQELIDTYTVTVIQLFVIDDGTADTTNLQGDSFDANPTGAPKLILWYAPL